jgi:hypothetical protein
MLLDNFTHNFIRFLVRNFLCLLEEEIGLLLVHNVELCSKSIADFIVEDLECDLSC